MLAAGSVAPGQQKQPAISPSFIASATTPRPGANVSQLAVNLPTYIANDHVLVLLCGDFLAGTDTATSAGWTQDGKQSNGNQIAFAFHRKMAGNEGSTATFTFPNAFERPYAVAASYRGASGLEASIAQSQNTPVTSWSLGPITTTGLGRTAVTLIFSFSGVAGTDFTTVNGGGVKRVDVTDAGSPNGFADAAMIAEVGAPSAANYSMGGGVSHNTTWMGVLIALIPT